MKKNEQHLKKLESEKKREQYERELGVVLWNSVNTTQADLVHTPDWDSVVSIAVYSMCIVCEDAS